MAWRSINPLPHAVGAFIALVWLGLLLGVSFLATPVKFHAPSLDLAVALEVGRVTFAIFSKVEWGLSLLLVSGAFLLRASPVVVVFAVSIVLVVMAQSLWLLPVLDTRVEAIIAGGSLPPSMHHAIYAALEVAKAGALVLLAVVGLFRLGWCDHAAAIAR